MIVHPEFGAPLHAGPKDLPGGEIAYVMPLILDRARLCVGDRYFVRDAY